MLVLKPLFFKKYRPKEKYTYPDLYKDCSIKIDGKHLSILTAAPNLKAKGTVILAHPMKRLGKYFFVKNEHTKLYLNLGYNVVLFDFNGFGESEDRGFQFPEDVFAVIKTSIKLFPDHRPVLHGISFGASQIILGALKNEDLVKGLIIESAVSSNLAYYKGRGSRLYHLLVLYNTLFPKKNEHNIYTKMIKKLENTPLLLIYGKRDAITPIWMGKKLLKNANDPKKLEVFNTEHLTTIHEEPEKYTGTIQSFMQSL